MVIPSLTRAVQTWPEVLPPVAVVESLGLVMLRKGVAGEGRRPSALLGGR